MCPYTVHRSNLAPECFTVDYFCTSLVATGLLLYCLVRSTRLEVSKNSAKTGAALISQRAGHRCSTFARETVTTHGI